MAIETDLPRLRAQVLALGPRRPGRRLPAQLREELKRASARLATSMTQRQISEELGVSLGTIQRWQRPLTEEALALIPVEVLEPPREGLRMVTRHGHVIEGLSVSTVAELVRLLG